MTDEEKVEEYMKEVTGCEEVYNDIQGKYEWRFDEEQIKQAYLDGLKEGREGDD